MQKKTLQLYKLNLFGILFLFLVITNLHPATSTGMDTTFFEVKIDNNHSIISIKNQHDWQFKQLNESPAAKILLKAFRIEENHNRKLNIDQHLPAQTGVKLIRIIPMRPGSYLIVLELKETMEFEWITEDQNQIALNDEFLFNESEMAYRRGLFLHKEGKLGEALSAYRNAVFRDKSHANAYYKAAQIRHKWKQNELAEINYRHAERLGCDSVNLYLHMADFYRSQDRKELSKKYENIYNEKLQARNLDTTPSSELADHFEQKYPSAIIDSLDTTPFAEQMMPTREEEKDAKATIPTKIILYAFGCIILLIYLTSKFYKQLQFKKYHDKNKLIKTKKNENETGIFETKEHPTDNLITFPPDLELENDQENFIPEETEQYFNQIDSFAGNIRENNEELSLLKDLNFHNSQGNNRATDEDEFSSKFLKEYQNSLTIENREAEILRLYEDNIDVSVIARKMGIGQGEVDLYIRFSKEELKEKV